jgi:hypothetical protein
MQVKNSSAGRRIARKLNVRKLKHTVNKVPSLRDFARRSGERNNLAVFIDFILTVYKNFLFFGRDGHAPLGVVSRLRRVNRKTSARRRLCLRRAKSKAPALQQSSALFICLSFASLQAWTLAFSPA